MCQRFASEWLHQTAMTVRFSGSCCHSNQWYYTRNNGNTISPVGLFIKIHEYGVYHAWMCFIDSEMCISCQSMSFLLNLNFCEQNNWLLCRSSSGDTLFFFHEYICPFVRYNIQKNYEVLNVKFFFMATVLSKNHYFVFIWRCGTLTVNPLPWQPIIRNIHL